uniref:BRCT domain-containing protein n=1 Tax=Parastrongyloides trichosuri TaxID=131310 RepID=A0A0N4ZTZ1_PARTI
MNNNEEVVITSQENGPVGSTVENVPPAQETAKEDENVESKEVSTPAKEDINTEIVSEDKKEENDVEPVEKVVVTETVKEVIVTETVEETSASGNEKKIVEVVETVTETTTTVVEKEKSSEEELKIDEEPPVPLNCEEEKNLLNNEAKEVNNEKKEDKVDSLEEEQKVDEIMEATKNNESVSETPLDEKEEEDTTTAIRTSSRRKRITAVQEAESTPKSRPRRGVTVKEDVEEEPTPAKRGRKVQKNLKATNDDEEVTEESAKTPSTGRRGRKPASKVQEEVVEDEEEPMEVDDEVEIKTPKKTKGQNKKGGVKRKNNEEPQTEIKKAKADNDAYDIDNIDDHPDISDSFKVERQSNGGAKFLATSNPKRGRFQEIEKAAKERNADSFIENSEEAEDLGEKKSISVLTLSDKKLVSQIDDEKTPKGKTPKTSKVNKTTAKTPKSVAKSTTVKATPKATPAKNKLNLLLKRRMKMGKHLM